MAPRSMKALAKPATKSVLNSKKASGVASETPVIPPPPTLPKTKRYRYGNFRLLELALQRHTGRMESQIEAGDTNPNLANALTNAVRTLAQIKAGALAITINAEEEAAAQAAGLTLDA